MALQYFSRERLDDLRHLYSEDKLFQTFTPVLCELQLTRGELDPAILWHEVEILREKLKVANHPETEIYYLIGFLKEHLAYEISVDGNTRLRSDQQIVESMLIILLLLMFQLTDATPASNQLDKNPNNLACRALAHVLTNPDFDWYIKPMKRNLTLKQTDLLGNPIILPVVDYMKAKISLDAMDEIAKNKYDRIIHNIDELSKGLYPKLLHISNDLYVTIWKNICLRADLMQLMSKKSPRTYDMDFNIKMFCNVLGILQYTKIDSGKSVLDTNVQEVNNAIAEKNYRNYITYYNQCDSNCAYTKDQFKNIQQIIKETLSEPQN